MLAHIFQSKKEELLLHLRGLFNPIIRYTGNFYVMVFIEFLILLVKYALTTFVVPNTFFWF